MSKAKKIVEEIVEKVEDYESNQSGYLEKVGEWGDLFRVKRPARKDNTYSNPRLTEMFRAVNTLGTMMFRMQTSQDPYFEVAPMMPLMGSDQLLKIQSTLDTQLLESKYKGNLLLADMSVCLFGTVIVQEDYEELCLNTFGRRLPVTTFKPRSMLQVAFERGCTDIDNADWLTTSDLISNAGLMKLGREADDLGQNWNKAVLEHAANEKVKGSDLNRFVMNKMAQLGYMGADGKAPQRKEILPYYGKLDCMNDGVEYIAVLVNRKHLVRFHPNRNQHGKRNFRVAHWIKDPLNLDALGLGLGGLLGDHHKSMDANRQKIQDKVTFDVYSMMERLRAANIDDGDLKIRPLQIIDTDERDGIRPIRTDSQGLVHSLKLEELLKSEFMNSSGAVATLQAMLTDATATESSLAQNEAVRNISVKTELISESLMREHLKICHSNNVEYMKEPINVNVGGNPQIVYPSDLQADVDFRIKLTVDKDYKPKRLETLVQIAQILTSTKSQHPDLGSITIKPVLAEIMRALGVPESAIFVQQDPMQALAAMLMGGGAPGAPGALPGVSTGSPDALAAQDALPTPVGPVAGSVNA